MAGKNERQMLFDLRGGHRGKVVKVVYAVLAVLMGLSLFLVVGGFNIAELFNGNSSSGEAAKAYEEQAERIEAKLKKDPGEPDLLKSLTRAQINAGNAHVTIEPNGEPAGPDRGRAGIPEGLPVLVRIPESDRGTGRRPGPAGGADAAAAGRTLDQLRAGGRPARFRLRRAADRRRSTDPRSTPGRPSPSTPTSPVDRAGRKSPERSQEARNTKSEREQIDKQLDEFKKNADRYRSEKAKAEKAEEEAAKAGGSGETGLTPGGENPLGGLGGAAGRIGARVSPPDGPCWARTYDLEIKSLLLYQLS